MLRSLQLACSQAAISAPNMRFPMVKKWLKALMISVLNEQLLDRHRIGGLCECGSDVEESDEVSVVGAGRWLRSLTRAMSA